MLIFSFAATQEVKNVRMAVLNQDYGTARATWSRGSRARPLSLGDAPPRRAAGRPAIDRAACSWWCTSARTSRATSRDRPATVQLILDGRRSNAAQIVAGYAQAIVASFNAELRGASAAAGHGSSSARVWFNPNLETLWNTVPSLVAILTTLMGLVVTALSVARERELGTFEQLLVSPLEPIEIIVGKTVPAILIGLAEGTIIMAGRRLRFRVPFPARSRCSTPHDCSIWPP